MDILEGLDFEVRDAWIQMHLIPSWSRSLDFILRASCVGPTLPCRASGEVLVKFLLV